MQPKKLPTASDLAALMIKRNKPVLDLEQDAQAQPGPSPSRSETTQQIQAAIDAFSHPGLPYGRKTITANGIYYTDRPLFLDVSDLGFVGDGTGTISGFHGSSVFYVGIDRTPMGRSLTTDHIYDLFGVLDESAAPSKNSRWGLRFLGDSHVAFGSSGLTVDSGNSSSLTIDYGLDTSQSGNKIGPILGLVAYSKPAPFALFRMDDFQGGTKTYITFQTADGLTHSAYIPDPKPGVHRHTIQIDTNSAQVLAWVDGQSVTVDEGGLENWVKGVPLAANDDTLPFKINSCGIRANGFGSDWWTFAPVKTGGLDFGLIGLHISSTLKYQDQPQQIRVDGLPVNDSTRYFTKDQFTIGLLPLNQSPSELVETRLITSYDQGWFGISHGLFLSADNATEWSAVKGNYFSGVNINNYAGWQNRFGEAITLGFSLYLKLENCTLEGGQHGLGTWNWGSNYITRCYGSSFAGNDAAVYSYYAMQEFTDCEIPRNGKHLFKMNISSVDIVKLWTTDGSAARTESYFKLLESELDLSKAKFDVESADGPSKAVFDAQTGTKGGSMDGCTVTVEKLDLACPRADVPIARLSCQSGANPGVFELSGKCIVRGERKAPLVLVDPGPPSWYVDIKTRSNIGGAGKLVQGPVLS